MPNLDYRLVFGKSFDGIPNIKTSDLPGYISGLNRDQLSMNVFAVENAFPFGQALRMAHWREDGSIKLPLCPWNLGGDTFLTVAHYEQTDKSMNAALWADHRWDLTGLLHEMSNYSTFMSNSPKWEEIDDQAEVKLRKIPEADYAATQPAHERLRFVHKEG